MGEEITQDSGGTNWRPLLWLAVWATASVAAMASAGGASSLIPILPLLLYATGFLFRHRAKRDHPAAVDPWSQALYSGWFLLWAGYGASIIWMYPETATNPYYQLINGGDGLSPWEPEFLHAFPKDRVLTTVLPALCVALFTLPAPWLLGRLFKGMKRKVLYEEVGNDSYYMGFLLTLAGLSSSLLGVKLNTLDPQLLDQVIAKCGGAISTTFVAIVLRVVLLDMVELKTPKKSERKSRSFPRRMRLSLPTWGIGRMRAVPKKAEPGPLFEPEPPPAPEPPPFKPDCCPPFALKCGDCEAIRSIDQVEQGVADVGKRVAELALQMEQAAAAGRVIDPEHQQAPGGRQDDGTQPEVEVLVNTKPTGPKIDPDDHLAFLTNQVRDIAAACRELLERNPTAHMLNLERRVEELAAAMKRGLADLPRGQATCGADGMAQALADQGTALMEALKQGLAANDTAPLRQAVDAVAARLAAMETTLAAIHGLAERMGEFRCRAGDGEDAPPHSSRPYPANDDWPPDDWLGRFLARLVRGYSGAGIC